jgi:sialate O-acetylesterase
MRRALVVGLALAALACFRQPAARADVKPHPLISSGMVLQRDVACPLWGTADPGEEVGIQLDRGSNDDFLFISKPRAVGADGKWRQTTPPLKAGGPYRLTIFGKNKVVLQDVYVGEVWVCSGQSNMEQGLGSTEGAAEVIKESKNPRIRLFTVAHATSTTPRPTVNGRWLECNPSTVGGFSAVAYYFGRDLNEKLKVPIGLIHSSWGGTVAEAWTGKPALEANPSLRYLARNFESTRKAHEKAMDNYLAALEAYLPLAKKARAAGEPVPPAPPFPALNQNTPTVLYNAMIKPLQPFAIKGVIWYQGESNAGRAYEYRTLFPTLIKNWRDDWGLGDFPFLFVQLAPFMAPSKVPQESAWAELREAQLLTSLNVPNTAMAVITDAGDPVDIHPRRKKPAGDRLARAARALAYGEKIVYSGPVYDRMKVEDGKAVLSFKSVGKGLVARGLPADFTIAGADRKFHNAQWEIKGDTVVVWSDRVEKPVAVRFGWANYPAGNLLNADGLLASPFRTDDFPTLTGPKKPAPKKGARGGTAPAPPS